MARRCRSPSVSWFGDLSRYTIRCVIPYRNTLIKALWKGAFKKGHVSVRGRGLLFPKPSRLERGKVRSLNTFLDGYGFSSPYSSGRRLLEPAGTHWMLAELVVLSLYVHLTLENVSDIREVRKRELQPSFGSLTGFKSTAYECTNA